MGNTDLNQKAAEFRGMICDVAPQPHLHLLKAAGKRTDANEVPCRGSSNKIVITPTKLLKLGLTEPSIVAPSNSEMTPNHFEHTP
jgi:hypothetical protein